MTPTELATRIAALDWSGCSLQHQLAVNAAVTALGGRERTALPVGGNVVALRPSAAKRTVRLLTLDGAHLAERQFPAGMASVPWSWVRAEVVTLANCPPEAVGAAEADTGDFVTIDGIPYCRVVLF